MYFNVVAAGYMYVYVHVCFMLYSYQFARNINSKFEN